MLKVIQNCSLNVNVFPKNSFQRTRLMFTIMHTIIRSQCLKIRLCHGDYFGVLFCFVNLFSSKLCKSAGPQERELMNPGKSMSYVCFFSCKWPILSTCWYRRMKQTKDVVGSGCS